MDLQLWHEDPDVGVEVHGVAFVLSGYAMTVTAVSYSAGELVHLVATDLQGLGQVVWRLDHWPRAHEVSAIAEALYQQPEQ